MEIISRAEAEERGLVRYFTGKPCKKHGHIAERQTGNGNCIACDIARREANPEKKLEAHRRYREANAERLREEDRERARLYREANPERARENSRRHRRRCYQKNPELRSYRAMIGRCYDPKHISYKNYGARGIKVCDRWRFGEDGRTGFECFLADMNRRPTLHSIDRIDVNGIYEKSNCCWQTRSAQNSNQRRYIKEAA
jgi:hypothetical protein